MRVENLPRSKATVYLRKAEQFARAMERAAADGDWDAAGLGAVHAVISALDAITTFYLGKRSRSEDHGDVLLLAREIDLPGIDGRVQQAQRVLDLKNRVEYEARALDPAEAEAMVKRAARVVGWVADHLRSSR